ncbi:MAG: hypothetical protein HY716_10325 [Planctomycetes bacterium]|nr:hypothetical protein [Planctomycetota bacterium]
MKIAVPVVLLMLVTRVPETSAQEVIGGELGARGFFGATRGRLNHGRSPGISSRFNIEDDLDAGEETLGGGASLNIYLEEDFRFNVTGWQTSSDGSAVLSQTKMFGGLLLPAGTAVETDINLRYYSAGVVYHVLSEPDVFRIGLGAGVKALSFELDLTPDGMAEETLRLRPVYPAVELVAELEITEWLGALLESSGGIPSFTRQGVEIRYPFEARGALRLRLGSLALEGGIQVFLAEFLQDENRAEEKRVHLNMTGVTLGVSLSF